MSSGVIVNLLCTRDQFFLLYSYFSVHRECKRNKSSKEWPQVLGSCCKLSPNLGWSTTTVFLLKTQNNSKRKENQSAFRDGDEEQMMIIRRSSEWSMKVSLKWRITPPPQYKMPLGTRLYWAYDQCFYIGPRRTIFYNKWSPLVAWRMKSWVRQLITIRDQVPFLWFPSRQRDSS